MQIENTSSIVKYYTHYILYTYTHTYIFKTFYNIKEPDIINSEQTLQDLPT